MNHIICVKYVANIINIILDIFIYCNLTKLLMIIFMLSHILNLLYNVTFGMFNHCVFFCHLHCVNFLPYGYVLQFIFESSFLEFDVKL